MRTFLLGCITLWLWLATAQAAEKSLFWQLESPSGQISYLFGTMHTDDPRVTDFSPTVVQALKRTETFVMEVAESSDPGLFMLENGNLAQALTSDEFDKVRELADFHGMHLGATMQMKPWLLAVIFDLPKPQTPYAQDNLLRAAAEEQGKQVLGLETPQGHFGVMDSFSVSDQLVMLRAVLKRSQAEKQKDFDRLLKAYLAGDADKVAGMDEQITGGMLPEALWARMRIRLLDERNVVMAERSIALAGQAPVFIAVGAAHLAGKNGLLEAFRHAGFKLKALKK